MRTTSRTANNRAAIDRMTAAAPSHDQPAATHDATAPSHDQTEPSNGSSNNDPTAATTTTYGSPQQPTNTRSADQPQ